MENYLMINGKKILLTEEQTKVLSENSPFDRQPEHGIYYFISNTDIATTRDLGAYNDAKNFENANYCSNKELVIRREFYERVERNLWRFSMENGEWWKGRLSN